ncbi:MAG TPA: tetratricopeptide repeat protein [Kofleriaceae bacterium]|nr:tetratricopeptide repeat protein [Kofleriaceae bacterium]
MPKPHRIAIVLPAIAIEGPDAAYEREAAILVWSALIETCQRHPRLAVLDADATPLFPQDGHFAPQHAVRGGRPSDAVFAETRRDEVIWLELALGGKPGIVRLHAVARDGAQESFEALGRNIGEQIQQVLGAWLTARGLGVLPRPFESVTGDEVLAALRVIAPTLAEQARAWSLPATTAPLWSLAIVESEAGDDDADIDAALDDLVADDAPSASMTLRELAAMPDPAPEPRRSIARPVANRLPVALRVPALRVLELALREDLSEQILAVDPEHPQALLSKLDRTGGWDFTVLRRVIARAPGWAKPYETLRCQPRDREQRDAPSELEAVAAAGIATVCRPASLEVLEIAADALAAAGRTDEALRLLERAVQSHDDNPRAHLALLDIHRQTGRTGAWLERALRSAVQHGCPSDPALPWYPDQIHVDLRASAALLGVGRLEEAIALRGNRLAGREAAYGREARALAQWRKEPRFLAWCYGREGYFRGDDARALDGLSRIEPDDAADLAILLDALVALGHEDEAPLAWAHHGLGRGLCGPVARLAAARALMAAGEWRRGIEELWRVELTEPGRGEQVAIAQCALVMSGAPIEVIETALGDRIAISAPTLARRMARDAADFVPAAAKSGLVARALGKLAPSTFDPEWLRAFAPDTRGRKAIDAAFAELGPPRKGAPSGFDIADELQRGDRLVNRWLEVVFSEASEDDPAALAQAAAYTAAQALGRYLAATTMAPSTIAGALRTTAGEALALLAHHRAALADREARALLATLDPMLRRVDRWVGATWLGAVERALGIDERSGGDVAGFTRDYPSIGARILGPEETAVLSWSVARLHRERPDGWAGKVVAQASRIAQHTGGAAVDEWADAIAAQLAAREIELEDAIDQLHTACYLAEGKTAGPCVHAARVLLGAGRAPAALAVLCAGLRAAEPAWRDRQLATLADAWKTARLDVPLELDKVSAGVLEALDHGDLPRAERLARWAVAFAPDNAEAERDLGLALARQGKVQDALHHLVRGTGEQAATILAGVLVRAGLVPDAMALLDHASRWYARAEQWTGYASLAYEAGDLPRTARGYERAARLDPGALDPTMTRAWDEARARPPSLPRPRAAIYDRLVAGELASAADYLADPSWRVRRTALRALSFRTPSENQVDVTPRARAAAAATLADTIGTMDREALLARAHALHVREQAYFARDPVPRLGERMTRPGFLSELRARGGVVVGDEAAPPPGFVDREIVPGAKVSRASDYVSLLRELATLAPREALAQFDLDDAGYLELARAWAAAMDADPSIAKTIAAGLAKR